MRCPGGQAKDPAKSAARRLDRSGAHKRGTDIGQPGGRRRGGPRGRAPRFTTVEGERDRVADGDALVRDESRPAGMQSEICEAAGGVGNQGQGTIADYRRADTDEPDDGAKSGTWVEAGWY